MPKNTDSIFTAMCGSCANENALKAAFIAYRNRQRGSIEVSDEELISCMKNEPPGSPNLSILSFSGGFHGRTLGILSATRSKPIHKADIPSFNWPVAPFPKLKCPLDQYSQEDRQEEDRCLEMVRSLICEQKEISPVAGMIIEPIQSEGGDNYASPYFFQKLQKICKENGIIFIVDEVQTGVGATGKFWAHEYWDLAEGPDIVTFAKKMQLSGFFHKAELKSPQPFRLFNTWMGDPIRLMQAKVILDEIEDHQLLDVVNDVGSYLIDNLRCMQNNFPDLINYVRGYGTFIAFNSPIYTTIVKDMRDSGVNLATCGSNTIRLRPMLVFQRKHADVFLEQLFSTLSRLSRNSTSSIP